VREREGSWDMWWKLISLAMLIGGGEERVQPRGLHEADGVFRRKDDWAVVRRGEGKQRPMASGEGHERGALSRL